MKEPRDIVYTLLEELKTICEKHNIPYFLTGWTALCAYGRGYLGEDVMHGQIMIRPYDANRLMAAIDAEKLPDRDYDYLGKNPDFPGAFIRYYAEDTSAFQLYHEVGFTHHGVHVDILILKYIPEGKMSAMKMKAIEHGLAYRNEKQLYQDRRERLFIKAAEVLFRRFRGNGKKVFDYLMKEYSEKSSLVGCQAYLKPGFNFTAPADLFEEISTCSLRGIPYNMAGDPQQFIDRLYRRDYWTVLKDGLKYPRMFTNTELPYRELFEGQNIDSTEYFKEMYKLFLEYQQVYESFADKKKYFDKTWAKLRAFNQAFELKTLYSAECVEEIQKAYCSGDYEHLYQLVNPYLEFQELCVKHGIKAKDFFCNEELESFIKKNNL